MSRIILQNIVPDHLRGRVLGIALMDRGFISLGVIVTGAIASWAGAFWAGIFMGFGCVTITLYVAFRWRIWSL